VLFIPKKSDELWLCMEYRKLNQWTNRKTYPITRISSVFEAMKGSVIFSKFDLKSCIQPGKNKRRRWIQDSLQHQVWVLWVFYLCHLGWLTNAPVMFQSFGNDIFSEDIGKYCQSLPRRHSSILEKHWRNMYSKLVFKTQTWHININRWSKILQPIQML